MSQEGARGAEDIQLLDLIQPSNQLLDLIQQSELFQLFHGQFSERRARRTTEASPADAVCTNGTIAKLTNSRWHLQET